MNITDMSRGARYRLIIERAKAIYAETHAVVELGRIMNGGKWTYTKTPGGFHLGMEACPAIDNGLFAVLYISNSMTTEDPREVLEVFKPALRPHFSQSEVSIDPFDDKGWMLRVRLPNADALDIEAAAEALAAQLDQFNHALYQRIITWVLARL